MSSPANDFPSWSDAPIAVAPAPWFSGALSPLDWLFLCAMATVLLALVLGRWQRFAPILSVGYSVQFWALAHADLISGPPVASSWVLHVLGHTLGWRYDSLSWFFAMLTIGMAFVSSLLAVVPVFLRLDADSGGGAGQTQIASAAGHGFHVSLALATLGNLCLVGASDFLGLYLGWELAVWCVVPLIWVAVGMVSLDLVRFVLLSFAGGMSLLAGLTLVLHQAGSFDFTQIRAVLAQVGAGPRFLLVLLLGAALGLRLSASLALRWRQLSRATPALAYWFGIGSRIGFFALVVVLVRLLGVDWLTEPAVLVGRQGGWLWVLACWLTAALMLIAAWRAWREASAAAALGWLALSQSGFVLLALLVGGLLGSASALLQLFSLALAESVLVTLVLLVLPGAQTRSGHAALPGLALAAALLATASVVGLPPSVGFVAKWLLYQALLTDPVLGWVGWGLLAMVLAGALLSALVLLRLLDIRQPTAGSRRLDLPIALMAPLLGLSAVTLLAGILPGPALGWVASAQQALGLPTLHWTLGGVRDGLDMRWLSLWLVLLMLPVLAVLWWSRRRLVASRILDGLAALRDWRPASLEIGWVSRFWGAVRRLASRAGGARRTGSRAR